MTTGVEVTIDANEPNYLYQTNRPFTIFKGNNEYEKAAVLTVVAATEYKEGTVLSFDASTGKYAATDSTNTATKNAYAILASEIKATNADTEVKVTVCISGDVDEETLIFRNGPDSINTVSNNSVDTFKTELRKLGIISRQYKAL